MKLSELFDKLEGHPELEGVGFLDTDKGPTAVVRHKPSSMFTQFPLEVVKDLDWPLLESVLLGIREPRVLNHMSRVVGYFSRIENWNQSKIGELRDRHKGNYIVQGA